MSPLGRNVVANMFGRAWASGIAIALTPIYVSILGIEAYGLIGAFTVLQTVFMIFDFGLGLTLNRQLSALSIARDSNAQLMRDTVRTFERVYFLIGAIVAGTLVVIAPFLSRAWFHTAMLSTGETTAAIALMGIAIGMQWTSALYLGGLLGLERQIRANVTLVAAATMRGLGAVAVLHMISPTIAAFFAWQVIVGGLQTFTFRVQLLRSLPVRTTRDQFRRSIFAANVRFAGALTGITVLGTLVTQLDKIVLSAIVSLEAFGYYALAATVTSGLYIFVAPVFNAAFPQLVAAVGRGEQIERIYHRACQLASLLLLPPAVALVVFAPEALNGWLGTTQSETTVWLVRILAVGTALNGLANLPYALMLAAGWTRLPLVMNLVAVAALIPLLILLSTRFGAMGGATAWLAYNIGVVLIGVPVMHRRLLRGHALRWYAIDVGAPLLGALAAATLLRIGIDEPSTRPGMLVLFVAAVCASGFGAWLLTPARASLVRGLAQLVLRGTRFPAK
jgi:O-antigen/teichoic acid export membrane protein